MDPIDLDEPVRQNHSLLLHETEEGLAVWVADRESVTLAGDRNLVLDVLSIVDGSLTPREIVDAMSHRAEADTVLHLLHFCFEQNLIQPVSHRSSSALGIRDLLKWDRQISNFAILDGVDDATAVGFQEKLHASHVLVLGIGGVGGYLAAASAMIGIGAMTLVDFDFVELSNTSRQILYSEDDIGNSKIDCAVRDLHRRNPGSRVHAIEKQVVDADSMVSVLDEASSALGGVDLVLVAADQPRESLVYAIDDGCVARGVPYLLMSPHDFSRVSIGPLIIPGTTASYSDVFPRSLLTQVDGRIGEINDRFVANIMDPYNGLVAKMAMVEVVKFLTEYRQPSVVGRMLDLDTSDWSLTMHELAR